MRARGYPSRISRKSADAALTMLLYGSTPERFRTFTAQSLAASYNVPLAKAEKKLADARLGRGL